MQSFDLPTVGGTISVNAHGMDHRIGGIASTIQSLRLMLANGSIQTVSRQENEELFQAVVGGYGLFGIILDAQLSLMDNLAYTEVRTNMNTQDFPAAYERIVNDPSYHMFYARLSTAPSSFLKEMIVYAYKVVDPSVSSVVLAPERLVPLTRFVFNLGRKSYLGMVYPLVKTKSTNFKNELSYTADGWNYVDNGGYGRPIHQKSFSSHVNKVLLTCLNLRRL